MQTIKNKIFTLLTPLFTLLMLTFGAGKAMAQTYNGGTWYSLYKSGFTTVTAWTTEESYDVFPPTAESISIQWYEWRTSCGCDLYLNGTRIARSTVTQNHTSTQTTTASVDKGATSVKVGFHATTQGYFGNIRIPLAKHIWLQKADGSGVGTSLTKDFKTVPWGTSKGIFINFRSFLTNNHISVTIEGDANGDYSFSATEQGVHSLSESEAGKSFSVGANACASANGASGTACSSGVLGKASLYDFNVYFFPKQTSVGTKYSGQGVYVKITDGTSTAKVYLEGKVGKRGQVIQNFPTGTATCKTTDVIDFNAYTTDTVTSATNSLQVSYSSNNGAVATINSTTGKVTIIKNGTVTFTASQSGSNEYNSAPSKSVTYTISKVTPTVTWPTIDDDLVYVPGAKVEDHWTVGSAKDDKKNPVGGEFACDEELQPAKNSTGYTVTFNPTNTNWYNDTTATIKQDVAKADQTITWNLEEKDDKDQYKEYATGETFDATATSELTVTYTSSDESIANIENGNQLRVLRANEVVTITASCVDPAGNWNDAPTVSKTFKTCGAKPNDWSEVTADTITYGHLLEESRLKGDVKLNGSPIGGRLEWVEPATLPNATKTTPEAFAVLFTPDDKELYASVTFDIPVTVAKANPDITWNLPNNLRENTNYNQFVTSSNKETPLSVTEYSPYLSVSDVNLSVTEIGDTRIQNVTIHLEQAGSDNFNAISDDKTVDIYPKVKQCVPVEINDVNDTVLIQNMAGSYEGTHTWCTSSEDGSGRIVAPVKYTQYYGLQLGEWDEGLKDKNLSDLFRNLGDMELDGTDKWIELNFTGVPDSLIFDTKLQHVYFDVDPFHETWTEAKQKNPTWEVYQKSLNGSERLINSYNALTTTSIKVALDSTTTAVKIKLKSPFAGFIQNLKITQRKYIRAYTNRLTFGTNEKKLQEPQKLKVYYSSVGSCEYSTDTILVTTEGDAAFYIDRDTITTNVGIDQWGKDSIYVRCNDVNKSGRVIFRSIHSNAELVVPVGSAKPEISASTTVFQTGTEHAASGAEKLYRKQDDHDFSVCFNAGTPRFDSLYIYGVSASASTSRQWAYDDAKKYNVPVVTSSNVHTPCFVYVKDNDKYVYKRTFDAATTTLNISAANKKLAFMGYKPVKTGSAAPAIQLNGNADVYFSNVEINANGVALKVNSATTTVYSRGDNKLIANSGAAVQLVGDANLTVEDSWNGGESRLALNPSSGNPSIDLSSNSNVTIQGSQLQLHNAPMNIFGQSVNMAIANMSGEKTTGSVAIKDGTITGAATLGMPRNTIIDGGTFNDGTVKVYDALGREFPPMNTDGDLLARLTMAYGELPATGYGKNHLVVDAGKVHPMLEDPNICKFTGQQNNLSDNNSNWVNSWNNNDVIVKHDMDVVSDITAKSLTINPNVTVTVKKGATLSVNSYSLKETVGNLRVENGGKVVLNNSSDLKVKDLVIEAKLGNMNTPANSAEINQADLLNVTGDVYFKLTFDPSGTISAGWYDFVVPFEVDVVGGIFLPDNTSKPLTNKVDFAIMEFSEERRAANEKSWSWVSGTLQPGKLYTITLDDEKPERNTYMFKKRRDAAIEASSEFSAQCTSNAASTDKGWNGMGNGTLQYRQLDLPVGAKIQVYDHENRCYVQCDAKDYKYAVGTAFFVQVETTESINLTTISNNRLFRAPRAEEASTDEFCLALTLEGAENASDHIWVSASDEATGEYVIGRDLVKMGEPNEAKVARIWAKRNNLQLCDAEMPLVYGEANCDLNVFAPADGTYLLEIENGPADAELYLTFNGKVIWDLTSSPASLVLKKGLKEGFGLRMKYNDAPGMAEGVDDINDDTQSMRKVLIDNKIYIITPEGAMYDVNGKLIR